MTTSETNSASEPRPSLSEQIEAQRTQLYKEIGAALDAVELLDRFDVPQGPGGTELPYDAARREMLAALRILERSQ